MTKIEAMTELIEAQDQYIKHLGEWVDSTAVVLSCHGLKCSHEEFEAGVALRERIDTLRKAMEAER